MDFRDRFPDLKIWPHAAANRCFVSFPFSMMWLGILVDYPAPDDSTTFLVMHRLNLTETADEYEANGRFLAYGVEAPVGSIVRTEFENGLISWSDFMSHKNWVIELNSPIYDDGPIFVRYISAQNIHPECKEQLRQLDAQGRPLKIVHDNLKEFYEIQKSWPANTGTAANEYFKFLDEYGDRLGLKLDNAA